MSASTRASKPIRLLGAILLLLTLGSAWNSTARAGCASPHPVSSESAAPTHAELLGFEHLVRFGAIPAPDDSETPPAQPFPCAGASCSGSPAMPHSAPPVVLPLGAERWATFPVAQSPHGSESLRYRPTDEVLYPVDHASSIFHPPRLPVPGSLV